MDDQEHILALICAADDDARWAMLLDQIGPGGTSALLVRELLSRCDPIDTGEEVSVRLWIIFPNEVVEHTVTFEATAVRAERGAARPACARVSFAATDLVRILYGSPGRHAAAAWKHELLLSRTQNPNPSQLPELLRSRHLAVRATHALLGAARRRPSLDDLAVRFGSDKWGGLHWYTPHYDVHFTPLRDEPIRLLEIGIGDYDSELGGGSLRMWQRYFRRGLIYGLDIFPKRIDEPRIAAIRGDQNDRELLGELAARIGPLDIVIDDGSHVNEHVLTSFNALFPHVRQGGLYVIEDLQTSYWPAYGGEDQDLASPRTSMGFLKSLVDGLNHKEYEHGEDHGPSYTDEHVVSVHFYHNLAFVRKGINDECGPARRPTAAWTDVVNAPR
jgi:hypothetical protein